MPRKDRQRRSCSAHAATVVRPGPSCMELATHEVVGWLLGAILAIDSPSKVEDVPALLAAYRCRELELLRTRLAKCMSEVAPRKQPELCVDLLGKLRAYCGHAGPADGPGVASATGTAQLVHEFVLRVSDLIDKRCQWRLAAPEAGLLRCPESSPAPGSTESLSLNGRALGGQHQNDGGQKRRRLSMESRTMQSPAAASPALTPCVELGAQAFAEAPEPGDAACGGKGSMSEEDWPEDQSICEGCGRHACGAEPWGRLNASLCARCRKARVPLMWALARECFQSLGEPAGLV